MTLLILPLRAGEDNEELRYALRSWEEHLLLPDGLYLLVVGDHPSWLEPDAFVQGNLYQSAQANVWTNVIIGAQWAFANGYDEAVYMNDDFFCTDPVVALPVYRRNRTLAQHLAMFPQRDDMWFVRSLDLTGLWLTNQGYPSPLSYDVHRPLLCKPQAMLSALTKWDGDLEGDIPQWRTIYGVLNEVEAVPVADVKLGVAEGNQHAPWVSTSDISWRKYGLMLQQRFPKPSRWEQQQQPS